MIGSGKFLLKRNIFQVRLTSTGPLDLTKQVGKMPGEVLGNFVYTSREVANYFLHLQSKATVDDLVQRPI
jgi:hypothetical protein